MLSVKRILAVGAVLLLVFGLLSPLALAKSGGGFSGGGRSSFSTTRSSSSTSRSPSTGTKDYSTRPSSQDQRTTGSVDSTRTDTQSGGGRQIANPNGNGYQTDTKQFSTPRNTGPDSLTHDYTGGQKGFGTTDRSYTTGRSSYNGTWDRELNKAQDRFPDRPQVGVYGPATYPPYYYHNSYWSQPWWFHLLFSPSYYATGWGYQYFAPRLGSWLLLLGGLGIAGFLAYRFLKNRA